MESPGKFIISLDFELLWGVRDKKDIANYGSHIEKVWQVIPRMIELFEEYNIHATFATVGFLFALHKEDLVQFLPENKPKYMDHRFSPYNGYIENITKKENQYHFAESLIEGIKKHPNQEIASHTFSHYYCLEEGQTSEEFEADLQAAIDIASAIGIELKSLVFPRNQFNDQYIKICQKLGIICYRGNEDTWFYKAASGENEGLIKRAFRLIDAYINISGHHTYSLDQVSQTFPFNIPASRFLRPYSSKLHALEPLKLRRIKKSMTHAARKGEIYHLWWHPHNFGSNTEKNFKMLRSILDHYKYLNEKYHFHSTNMGECAEECLALKK